MTATQSDAAQRRGWYHGWNIVAVCVLSQTVANGLPVNAFSLFLRDWSAQLHTPISTLQLGIAAFGLFCAVLSPKAGVFADKYPARWLMGGGLIVSFGHGVALLGMGVMLVGLAGGLWPLLAAAAAVEYGASEVGRAFGLLIMFIPVIALVPFLVARVQESTGSYAPGLAGLAALTFIGGAACLLMRERRRGSASQPVETPVIAPSASGRRA